MEQIPDLPDVPDVTLNKYIWYILSILLSRLLLPLLF